MDREVIMLIEGNEENQEIITMYLTNRGFDVVMAVNGKQALDKISATNPTLILLDTEIPGKSGFEVCKKIRTKTAVPIIFISTRRGIFDQIKSFECGGDDYLTKPIDFTKLEKKIKIAQRRTAVKRQDTLQYGELKIDLNNYTCYLNNQEVPLPKKEMELLIYLAKNPNQVWSQEQLYNKIWNQEVAGNIDTVKVHISNLRRKIELDRKQPKFIKTVRGFGYQFIDSI